MRQKAIRHDRVGASGHTVLRWLPLVLVVLVLAAAYGLGLQTYLSLDKIAKYQDRLSSFVAEHGVLSASLYVLVYVAAVGLSFPGASVLTAAGGFMFGSIVGTILTVLAATMGATIIFLIARTSLGDLLTARAGPRLQRLRQGFAEEAFSYLLFLRLAPIFPFWVVNLAAALFGMRVAPYILATAIGIIPGTFALSYFGQGLDSALAGDGPVLSAGLIIALALLAVMALVPVVLRRLRQRSLEAKSASRT